jgi:lipoprotein-anchoring transpeptidase ErfK/SrfK
MKINPPDRSTAGTMTSALTRFLVVLVMVALAWFWWKSSEPAKSPPAKPVSETFPPNKPSAPSVPPMPGEQRTPPLVAPRSLSLTSAMVIQASPILTSAPPVLSLVPTSRPLARVTAFTNPPALLTGPSAASNLPAASVSNPPSGLPSVSNLVSATARSDADAKFRLALAVQLALARQGISPGSMDGSSGAQTRAALRTFQEREGLPATGETDSNTLARLVLPEEMFTRHVVSAEEAARLRPMGSTWLAKSEQDRLDYETLLELVAEKYAASPKLLQRINPGVDWSRVTPGTTLVVPAFEPPSAPGKAAWLKIFLGRRTLQAFDESNRVLAHFPCSIAQRIEKRPAGETLRVAVVAPNPNYTFDPAVFPESPEAQTIGRKLILHPGPNNPVGLAWIGLDKPGYGIHGTPKPEDVGRTESHGCFRLANWNAEQLVRMVTVGTPIVVEP